MGTAISGSTFDCADPASLSEFWARLLGYDVAETSSDGALIVAESSSGFWIWFQRVPEGKAAKNRFHLDLRADDLEKEVARAESLGATTMARHQHDAWTWRIMQDPEGNEFCLGTAPPLGIWDE
jgi:predicted enzyme related to lactoylglutathione lyase